MKETEAKQWGLCGVIRRFFAFSLKSILYIICLPYTGTLAIVGLIFFILNEDFITESKLEAFSDWFNKISVDINDL